jgi:hypothetical protein
VVFWAANRNPEVGEIESPAHTLDLEKLERHAVLLVRGFFSVRETLEIRERAEAVVRRAYREGSHTPIHRKYPEGRAMLGDLLSMPEFADLDYIAFDRRVVRSAREILGDPVVYFGDSSIRVGNGGRGFHQDFVHDGRPTAGGVRFVFYLQDHTHHSGGLKVRLGSFRHRSRHRGTMMNVPTRLGDLVVFYLRTSHTGNNVRLKALPRLCLHPKLENLVPGMLQASEERERMCLVWTFSNPGRELDLYVESITNDYAHWRRCAYRPELVAMAARAGVELVRAVPWLATRTRDMCDSATPSSAR